LPHLSALPRRVEVEPGGDNELLVAMSLARDVVLRSHCAADDVFDWEVRAQDELFVAHGKLVGHAPRSLRLPAGDFVIRLRGASSQVVLAEEQFSMGDKPLVIELTR
jgi:hypothetical protein